MVGSRNKMARSFGNQFELCGYHEDLPSLGPVDNPLCRHSVSVQYWDAFEINLGQRDSK